MNAYDEWLRVKAGRKESSRRWCKRHGLQEQRLYEITKLRRQFEDLLGNAGLIWLGAAAQGARKNRAARSKAAATSTGRGGASKDKLRELKMRSQGRKRKVLEVDQGVSKGNEATEEGGSGGEDEAEQARRDLSAEVGEGAADFDASLDLSSLEFYMAQDVGECHEVMRLTHETAGRLSLVSEAIDFSAVIVRKRTALCNWNKSLSDLCV